MMVDPVTISPPDSSTAGETYSLMCSAALSNPIPLPTNVPSPTFEWFFGPNDSASLPAGVTPMPTAMSSNSTAIMYISTLQFSPLSQSHAGMYTCRLGAGRLANSAMLTVNRKLYCLYPLSFNCFLRAAPLITVMVTANLNDPLMVGQTGNTLACVVSGADNLNPTITYQWTRYDDSTLTLVEINSNTLTLSPLRLSNAGDYTCSVTVHSNLLNSPITRSATQGVDMIQSK